MVGADANLERDVAVADPALDPGAAGAPVLVAGDRIAQPACIRSELEHRGAVEMPTCTHFQQTRRFVSRLIETPPQNDRTRRRRAHRTPPLRRLGPGCPSGDG